jgi:hypothetical protein
VSEPEIRENARKALEDHAWQDAYEAYISLRDHEELTGEDWAGFAEAAWWSAHPNESLDAFERAYGTYSSEGNTRRAAYVALLSPLNTRTGRSRPFGTGGSSEPSD